MTDVAESDQAKVDVHLALLEHQIEKMHNHFQNQNKKILKALSDFAAHEEIEGSRAVADIIRKALF